MRPPDGKNLIAALRRGERVRNLAGVLVLLVMASATGKAESGPATRPGSAGGRAVSVSKRERLIKRRFDFLTEQYSRQLKSADWITRSIALISLSRMPTDGATRAIIRQLQGEKYPVGQLVAWQAMLGRAGRLDDKEREAWLAETWKMVRKGLFHGDLRVGLLEMLSAGPITREGRDYFKNLCQKTSSLDSSDIRTLIAMGRALRAWGDRELVEMLIRAMNNPSTAIRAELILQAAGAGVPWNRTPTAGRAYGDWWRENGKAFAAVPGAREAWRKLKPQFIPAPLDASAVDPSDRKWLDELELGKLELGQFDFAIAIDCSRSMRPEIERLKRDMRIMFAAFTLVAREPRVGVTLFAPGRIVKHLPLTANLRRLMGYLSGADIMGPPGEEEWAGALQQTMAGSKWTPAGKRSRRVIVLMSDEPITDPQFARAMPLAEKGAKAGFRIYGVMIRQLREGPNNPLAVPFDRTGGAGIVREADRRRWNDKRRQKGKKPGRSWTYYHDLASATGGRAIEVAVPQGGLGLGRLGGVQAKVKGKGKAPASPVAIAPIYPGGGPTNRVLTMVLVDAINPQYADRVEPFVKILVAYCQKAAAREPERRTWGKPDRMEPNLRRRQRDAGGLRQGRRRRDPG